MIPLPLDRVPRWEAFLESRWTAKRWTVRRDSLAISFGMLGLRWCEVALIEMGDLAERGVLAVRTAKRGRPRRIDVPEALADAACAMRQWMPYKPVERLFVTSGNLVMTYQSIRRPMREWSKEVFGSPFTFHCLRHTAAVQVYRRTRDVLAVSRFLGHKSLQWTQAYLASLEVVDVGGAVAFTDSVAVSGPRIYDPECVGEPRRESRRRELAAGEHVCSINDLMPFKGRGGVFWRCAVCGLTLGAGGSKLAGPRPSPPSAATSTPAAAKASPASAKLPASAKASSPRAPIGESPIRDLPGQMHLELGEVAAAQVAAASPAAVAKPTESRSRRLLKCDRKPDPKVCAHAVRERRVDKLGVVEYCVACGAYYGHVPPSLLAAERALLDVPSA